ncbi:MAG: HD domain-containing protein [Spirochaetaceae bacterium]|nr:HD domain-containing protein [Spirochaetaceae bacterium]
MVNKALALKIFEGFSIERWNDLVRPFDLIEMDKSAEKMVLVYIIGKFEEQRGNKVDWEWLIYASFFELLRKIALCDIKSPVQRMIRKQYPEEYAKLNKWVLEQYKGLITDEWLIKKFQAYIDESSSSEKASGKEASLEMRIFRAAHKFSTMREFEMIAPVNERSRLQRIEKELNEDIGEYLDLRGLQMLVTKQRPYEFLLIIEKLRFQTRWNQTPRVPKTSVLGHSFFVAVLTLLLSRDSGAKMCPERLFNNYFSALFHDLPEAVTRDIISPVKQATSGLPSIVKDIEDTIVKNELLPLMEDFYADELLYFTSDEFENRIRFADVDIRHVSFDDLNKKFNEGKYAPVDGRLVRVSDHIAAFLEADSSINYGITSKHLRDGRRNLVRLYPDGQTINGFDVAAFFKEFETQ